MIRAAKAINIRKEDGKRMEDEAKQMEAKLELLRRTMDAAEERAPKTSDGGRWKSGSAAKPITKGYVRSVLEAPRPKPRPSDGQSQRGPSGASTPNGTASQEVAAVSQLVALDTLIPAAAAGAQAASLGGGGGRAASNLQAAMRNQTTEQAEVESFLASLKLDRYVSLFEEHGFDCMEVVMEMQESHMQDIGMAAGHILKLRKRLVELNPAPVLAAPTSPPSAGSTRKGVSFGGGQAGERSPPKGAASSGGGGDDGCFNEEDSAASFQEALRAWREGGVAKTEENSPVVNPKVGPSSFWSSVGDTDVNLERCATPLLPTALSSVAETQGNPCPSEDKLCCYQCYKQFYAQFAVERESPLSPSSGGGRRRLCSEACGGKYVAAMETKAEAIQKRQEKLQQMKELQRALEAEQDAVGGEATQEGEEPKVPPADSS